jgi:uncharacterized protein YjbJ (UPF0337 family)
MNKDQIKGRAEQAGGKVKQETGELLDDEQLARKGREEQERGSSHTAQADAKARVQEILGSRNKKR